MSDALIERGWRDLPQAKPLRAWRDGELRALAAFLQQVLQSWAADWDVPWSADAGVRCGAGGDLTSAAWDCLGERSGAAAWLHWSGEEATAWAGAWFGCGEGDTPIVASVLKACRSDATLRLSQALELSPAPSRVVQPSASSGWSGDVLAALAWGAHVRLDAGLVEAVLAHGAEARPARTTPAAAPLVEVREALADSEVRLQVELSPFELGLGALQSLQVDDVLRLQHRADAPATVIDADGRALFRAWLARRHARWAVELAPLAGE